MQVKDPEAQSSSSTALAGLADADSEILQKLGVERLVGMAVRARDAPMRAATIAFVSKLARDSDTHEEIIAAGGLELLIGMILRLNEEAVWGLASMSSVEDNWAQIAEVMTVDAFGALKDLIELGGDYGKEGGLGVLLPRRTSGSAGDDDQGKCPIASGRFGEVWVQAREKSG